MAILLEKLEADSLELERDVPDSEVDPARLRQVIDRLEKKFCSVVNRARERGDHLAGSCNMSPVSWVARTCHLSSTSAADRLCVGKQLESLPLVAQALSSGEIGYQSAAAICHLREQLGDKASELKEGEMLGHARNWSVKELRQLCRYVRHMVDPDGFYKDSEDDYERRWLKVSPMLDGMHAVDGVLDPVTGAAFRSALDSLAGWVGPEDPRNHGQRMADALGELVQHAMDQGTLPRRNGVRPHVTVTTTLEGLKGELGVPAADLELGQPISTRTVERIACDCSLTRVLLADSVVTDVGRATRTVSPSTRRALKARDRGCRWPGCDRPVGWTQAHHIEFWNRRGPTNVPNLVLLCYHHHRLVHEGGWQVVKAGRELRFIPPERRIAGRARGPGLRWAA